MAVIETIGQSCVTLLCEKIQSLFIFRACDMEKYITSILFFERVLYFPISHSNIYYFICAYIPHGSIFNTHCVNNSRQK